VQVDPIKPTLKAPEIGHLTMEHNKLLSNFGFKFNLRRYIETDLNDRKEELKRSGLGRGLHLSTFQLNLSRL